MSAKIHATAVVDASAELGADVNIGPGCVIGPGVRPTTAKCRPFRSTSP